MKKVKHRLTYRMPNEGNFSQILDSLQDAENAEARMIEQGAKDTEIEMHLPECGQPLDDSIPV